MTLGPAVSLLLPKPASAFGPRHRRVGMPVLIALLLHLVCLLAVTGALYTFGLVAALQLPGGSRLPMLATCVLLS